MRLMITLSLRTRISIGSKFVLLGLVISKFDDAHLLRNWRETMNVKIKNIVMCFGITIII